MRCVFVSVFLFSSAGGTASGAEADTFFCSGSDNDLMSLGISDYFVRHATVAQQREQAGIDADSIVKSIIDRMN